MTDQRQPEPIKMASGPCPICSGLAIFDDERCALCHGTRRFEYPSEWTDADRERLADVWERETTIRSVAFAMRRPIAVVRDEAIRQGLYREAATFVANVHPMADHPMFGRRADAEELNR